MGKDNRINMTPAQALGSYTPSFETTARQVLAVVADDATALALAGGLAVLGDDFTLLRGNIRTAIEAFATEIPAYSLIVDLTGAGNAHSALEDLLHVCPQAVRVFVIGDRLEPSFHQELVNERGVTEYLPKPLTRDAVSRLLLPHLTSGLAEQAAGCSGAIVAVCGARGGVGASSIAINLAYEIMHTVPGNVALLDLHTQDGEIALMLSAYPGPELRIALEDANRVDSLFLKRTSIEIEPRLRLIASNEGFDACATVTETGLLRVLDLLQKNFSFIVADVPMPIPPQMLRILTLARQVVAVAAPDVASMRETQNIRRLIASVTGADRMICVLNRANMKGGLERQSVEAALHGRPDISIPDLGHAMLEAVNLGVPAIQKVPSLRRHLAPLVREITGTSPSGTSGSWLFRLFGNSGGSATTIRAKRRKLRQSSSPR